MIYFGPPTAALYVHLHVLTCGPPSNQFFFFPSAIFTVALLFDISWATKSRSFHFFWPVLIVFCRICPYLHRTISKFPKWAIFKFMKHELAIAPLTPIIYTAQVFLSFFFLVTAALLGERSWLEMVISFPGAFRWTSCVEGGIDSRDGAHSRQVSPVCLGRKWT